MKKKQLFLLHFAGGNYYSFQFMLPYLKDFEVVPVELPGRGKRMTENLLRDRDLAARDLYKQVTQKLRSSEFILYGHSMGAYLALRVCALLEQAGKTPSYLVVSGNPGPGVGPERKRYLLSRDKFVLELRKLGGFPPDLLEDEAFFTLYEPILRADFEIAESRHQVEEPVINVPIYAIMGDKEETSDKIANWQRFTTSGFDFELLAGNHFFIHDHPKRMGDILNQFSMQKL